MPRPVSSYSARKLLGNVAAGYTLSAAGIQTEHYKAWHRPAESSVVKGAFPDLVRGVLPQIENPPPAVLRQPEQLAAASDADLNHLRNYLAEIFSARTETWAGTTGCAPRCGSPGCSPARGRPDP